MWMLLNVASPFSWVMSISRSVACAGLPGGPALMTMLTGRPGMTTDWHRLVSVASLMPDTATRWFFGSSGFCGLAPFSDASPPYWTKPVPCSLSAETLKVDPDTANEAAMAPLAMPTRMAPAAATAGTEMATKRRHLVRPCTRPCASFTGVLLEDGVTRRPLGNAASTGDEMMRWVRVTRTATPAGRPVPARRAACGDVPAKRNRGQEMELL